MENNSPRQGSQSLDGLLINPDNGNPNALQGVSTVEESTHLVSREPPQYAALKQQLKLSMGLRLGILGAVIILLLVATAFLFIQRNSRVAQVQTGSFGEVHLPLEGVAISEPSSDSAQSLKVNGRLEVTGSIVIEPSSQPNNPVSGQIYYDQTTNRLAYYNGQQFINLTDDATAASIGGVTNTFGSGAGTSTIPTGVLLQGSSPGIQQPGNFNISGIGIVGTLKTAVIDSAGSALFINPSTPVGTVTQPGGTPATLGLITGSQTSTGNEQNVLIATEATMPDTAGTATSITVFIVGGSASSHIQVGLYEDDGDIPNKPATLLASSAITNIVPNSFNTLSIPSTALSPNTTYWMAFNTDDSTMKRQYNGGGQVSCFITSGFGFMPDPFSPPGCFSSNQHYAIYVNYTTVAGGAGGAFGKAQFSLSATGQALFQNVENSPTAFQIQNAAGTTTVFNVDTVNGRIAIGKANAAHKLDIAGGDINLSNSRSIRFGGLQALSSASSGMITALTNFSSGGTVVVQGDNFVVQDINGLTDLFTINTSTGSISLNGKAASSFSTSAGALTLTSAASATWGIATASSGTGGDLTLKAGGGSIVGNNNGGDLILQGGAPNGTGAPGSVIVRPLNNATDTFQIQNSSSTPLFNADSSGMTISITGTNTTFATLLLTDAHFKSTQSTAPTIGTPTNCGTAPIAAIVADSTDSAGSFTITTGTGGTASTCDSTITFQHAYGATPKSILVVGKTDAASVTRQIFVSAASATTFTVTFATSAGGADNTTYNFSYWVIE